MQDRQGYNEIISLLYKEIKAFERGFYEASPDRWFFGSKRKSYSDYVDAWLESEAAEDIEKSVKDYPKRHWLVRLRYWFTNHEDYKKYQWIVYQRKVALLHQYEDALLWPARIGKENIHPFFTANAFLSLLSEAGYLPKVCRGLLSQLTRTMPMLSLFLKKLVGIELNEEKKPVDPILGESLEDKIKADKKRIAKVCGFLKVPYTTSLASLEATLDEVQKLYAYGRRHNSFSDKELGSFDNNMLLNVRKSREEIAHVRKCRGSDFQWDGLGNALDSEKDELEASRQEGIAEADKSWAPVVENGWDRHILYRVQLKAALRGEEDLSTTAHLEEEKQPRETSIKAPLSIEAQLVKDYQQLEKYLKMLKPEDLENDEEKGHYAKAKQAIDELKEAIEVFWNCRRRPVHLNPQDSSRWMDEAKKEACYQKGVEQYWHLSWLKEKAMDKNAEALSIIPDYGNVNKAKLFYFFCGFFNLMPNQSAYDAIPGAIRRYIQAQGIHPDQVKPIFKDEAGEEHEMPDDCVEHAREECAKLFRFIHQNYDILKKVNKAQLWAECACIGINSRNEYINKGKLERATIDNRAREMQEFKKGVQEQKKDIDRKDKVIARLDSEIMELKAVMEEKHQRMQQEIERLSKMVAEAEMKGNENVQTSDSCSTAMMFNAMPVVNDASDSASSSREKSSASSPQQMSLTSSTSSAMLSEGSLVNGQQQFGGDNQRILSRSSSSSQLFHHNKTLLVGETIVGSYQAKIKRSNSC